MKNDTDLPYERSGDDRIKLYAEIGRYFSADGIFNEPAFRSILKSSLQAISKPGSSKKEKILQQGRWLSDYLSDVLDYLEEKNMPDASSRLLIAAINEASAMGIDEIAISAEHLRKFFNTIPLSTADNPKRRNLDAKKQKIYQAALKVFSKEGYHLATIEKIASQSGIAKGTVYRYFKSKEELLRQLLEEHFQEIVNQFNALYSKDTDILQQIKEIIVFWVEFIEKNPHLYRLIQSEAIFQRSDGGVMFYDYLISHLPMIKERVVALNREGKLKTTSFYTIFYGILGFIDGVVHKWFHSNMKYSLKDEIPLILEALFNGFAGDYNRITFYPPPSHSKPKKKHTPRN